MFASVNSQNTLFSYENLNIEKKELVKLQNENKTPLEIPSDQIGGVRVIFEDKNKNLISINLSEENFKSLQENFRSYTNYIPKEDGSIRLNAEAENFISSWFNTALNLDSAKINSNLYDDYNLMSFKKDRPTLNQSLNQLGKSNFNAIDENANITQKLNFLIDKDVNKDGKIELGESKPDEPKEILNSLRESLNGSSKITDRIDPQKINEEQKKKIKKVDNKKEEDLLKKAQEKGLSALSANEQEKLKTQNPKEFKKLQEKSLQNLSLNLNKDFNQIKLVDKLV
ncbi:hypothetical protein DU474_00040 [Campylobacter novaezeelandiae]|uniref:Uncharacterized protein n=1 Tax=Campylobacter novaezeelandiae TaxID=2267891 RepID=A0A4Q9JW81_9BACT|nr:hypothetical protein [Campylobacter novaezeelandiae]QWU79428.1 hypothetical protein CNZW441b_0064 [Campylobacter novaezeelandiae]TBR80960.1 hypothetical protein DU474_00040 [Campylobacter novaezeelandiae]TBR82016.1 hypothetical protein DU473_01710 [Campylobacter novaezeelandiae]